MNGAVFGADYANAYDVLYQDKDYASECDLIERVFAEYAAGRRVRSVLDLGCGTGGHAVPLAEHGYEVVGVDRSAEMLRHAVERSRADHDAAHASARTDRDAAHEARRGPRFELGDIGSIDLRREFDAVVMMFAVLGYQVTNEAVQAALASARRHLAAGGLLFGDLWYGPAVLAQRPSERVKVIELPGAGAAQIIRV